MPVGAVVHVVVSHEGVVDGVIAIRDILLVAIPSAGTVVNLPLDLEALGRIETGVLANVGDRAAAGRDGESQGSEETETHLADDEASHASLDT